MGFYGYVTSNAGYITNILVEKLHIAYRRNETPPGKISQAVFLFFLLSI